MRKMLPLWVIFFVLVFTFTPAPVFSGEERVPGHGGGYAPSPGHGGNNIPSPGHSGGGNVPAPGHGGSNNPTPGHGGGGISQPPSQPSNSSVFHRTPAFRGGEARGTLVVPNESLKEAEILVEAYNGSTRRCSARLSINYTNYQAIDEIRPGSSRTAVVTISGSTLRSLAGRSVPVVCYVDAIDRNSWVSLNVNFKTGSGHGGNNPYPGNGGGYGGYDPYPGGGGGYGGYDPYPGGGNNGPGHGGGSGGYDPYPGGAGDADYFIRRAKKEFSYDKADRILIDGSRRIDSLRGILKLAAEAFSTTTVREICDAMGDLNRRFRDVPELTEIKAACDGMNRYDASDYMLLKLAARLPHVRRVMYMAAMAFSASSAGEICDTLDKLPKSRALEIPDGPEIRKAYGMFSRYDAGDHMLLKVAPFIREYRVFDTMIDLAFSSTIRRELERIRSEGGQGGSHHGGYNDPYVSRGTAVAVRIAEDQGGDHASGGDVNLKSAESGIGLTQEDIENLNTVKVADFISRFKAGKVKKSYHLKKVLKNLKERLTAESFQGGSDEARNLLNALMAD